MTKAKLYSVSSPAQATEKKQMQRVIIIHGMNKRLMRTWKDVELHVARIVTELLLPRLAFIPGWWRRRVQRRLGRVLALQGNRSGD